MNEVINIYRVVKVLYFSLFIVFSVCMVGFLFLNKIYIHTSTMAVVMALGIITQGVLLNFFGPHFFHGVFGKILTILDLALWCSFSFSFLMAFFNKRFREIHYYRPIKRFGMGTWVAGTSICGILIYKQFYEFVLIAKLISYFNLGLWLIYIALCVKAFYDIYRGKLTKNVHGILLLTTVSTQSIVLLISTVFKHIPIKMDILFISLGVSFYILSTFLIIRRYCTNADSRLIETEWNNTNCILHGALSITGLASLVSHAASKHGVMVIWICAAIVFLTVELIEIYRLVKRLKSYGLKKGILIYDVSQWSRVFTFGMFYTFTYLSNPNFLYFARIRKMIIMSGIWTILLLVLIEFFLCSSHIIQIYRNQANKHQVNPTSVNSSV